MKWSFDQTMGFLFFVAVVAMFSFLFYSMHATRNLNIKRYDKCLATHTDVNACKSLKY